MSKLPSSSLWLPFMAKLAIALLIYLATDSYLEMRQPDFCFINCSAPNSLDFETVKNIWRAAYLASLLMTAWALIGLFRAPRAQSSIARMTNLALLVLGIGFLFAFAPQVLSSFEFHNQTALLIGDGFTREELDEMCGPNRLIPIAPNLVGSPKQHFAVFIDQTFRGVFFDVMEVYDLGTTALRPNPEVFWFSGVYTVYRIVVPTYVIAYILSLFGFSRRPR